MTLGRTFAVVLRQYYLVRGSLARFLPLFLWVAIDIVLWGFLSRYLNQEAAAKVDFIPRLLGAVLLWDFLSRVTLGVTTAFLEDVWSRNFLNFFATPLSVSEYVGGLVATSILTSAVGLAVMLGVSVGVFGLPFLAYGLMSIPFIFILLLTGIALGVLGAAMVLRLGPAAEWFVWTIPALVSPFAGVYYPLSTLPEWMRAVSYALPPSYVFEGLRASLSTGYVAGAPMVLGAGLSLLYLAVACWFFKRTYLHAIRTGLIARYSAESVA